MQPRQISSKNRNLSHKKDTILFLVKRAYFLYLKYTYLLHGGRSTKSCTHVCNGSWGGDNIKSPGVVVNKKIFDWTTGGQMEPQSLRIIKLFHCPQKTWQIRRRKRYSNLLPVVQYNPLLQDIVFCHIDVHFVPCHEIFWPKLFE